VNQALCYLGQILNYVIWAYTVVLLIYAIASWIPDIRGRWLYYISALVDPLLQPLQRVIPPLGGLSIAFLVLILLVQFVGGAIVRSLLRSCFIGY
jgi:YggT family protein